MEAYFMDMDPVLSQPEGTEAPEASSAEMVEELTANIDYLDGKISQFWELKRMHMRKIEEERMKGEIETYRASLENQLIEEKKVIDEEYRDKVQKCKEESDAKFEACVKECKASMEHQLSITKGNVDRQLQDKVEKYKNDKDAELMQEMRKLDDGLATQKKECMEKLNVKLQGFRRKGEEIVHSALKSVESLAREMTSTQTGSSSTSHSISNVHRNEAFPAGDDPTLLELGPMASRSSTPTTSEDDNHSKEMEEGSADNDNEKDDSAFDEDFTISEDDDEDDGDKDPEYVPDPEMKRKQTSDGKKGMRKRRRRSYTSKETIKPGTKQEVLGHRKGQGRHPESTKTPAAVGPGSKPKYFNARQPVFRVQRCEEEDMICID